MIDFRCALSLRPYACFGSRVAFFAVLVALNACGGGAGGSSPTNTSAASAASGSADSGEIAIALTDAEGDFESYVVDVDYLRLQRANGDVVETVPLSTRFCGVEPADGILHHRDDPRGRVHQRGCRNELQRG